MGEIAEDIINGECCALCGEYFYRPNFGNPIPFKHGYPAACKDCYIKDCGYQKAIAETF